jgi:acetyl esterase
VAVAQDKLHPRARAILDATPPTPPLSSLTPAQARGGPVLLDAAPEPVGTVYQRVIVGPGGPMALRVYRPKEQTRSALVYLHGGGFVLGSLEGADGTCRALANRGRTVVVSVDYRLAPETKFPGAVDDAYAALQWVAQRATELGVSPDKIGVGGSSAGGSLAAAAALVARDRGTPKVAFQLLTVPVMDLNAGADSFREFGEGYGLTTADMEWFGRHYVRTEADVDDPRASVARADLRGMPPAFVITAECDPLRDDGEAYAKRLKELGIAASYKRYAGMFHGFMSYAGILPEARQAFDDAGAALREALA